MQPSCTDEIAVTVRAVCPRVGRKRRVFDTAGVTSDGIAYGIDGADTASDARRQTKEQIDFIRANPPFSGNGFRLFAQGVNWFCAVLPSKASFLFSARNRDAALARLACDYHDREDVRDFVRAALDTP